MFLRLSFLLVFLFCGAIAGYRVLSRIEDPLIPDRIIVLKDLSCVSGLTYRPDKGTLLLVSDKGEIAEISLDGNLLRHQNLANKFNQLLFKDLEDITLDENLDYAWVLDERNRRIARLDLADFSIVEMLDLDPGLLPDIRANKRFEGVARMSNGDFVIAHEAHPPALLRYNREAINGTCSHYRRSFRKRGLGGPL